MKYLSILLLLASTFGGGFSFSTTYYVNGNTGNDANAGTSAASPFRTLAAAQAVVATGDTISIYGGDASPVKYREQLTLPAANITVTTYGALKPVLDASDPIPTCGWMATPGYANVYQANITVANTLGWVRAWEENRAMERAQNLADLVMKRGRYWVSGDPQQNGIVNFVLYVHPIGDDNPATNNKVYEFNARAYGLFSSYAANVSGVLTQRNLCNNGSFEVGPASYISRVAANDGTKHNLLIHQGSTAEDISMENSCYGGQNRIALVINDNVGDAVSTTTLRRIVYTENLENNGTGFYAHVNVSGKFGPVLMEDCRTVGKVYTAISAFASTSLTITGGNFVGNVVAASDSTLIQNSTITNAQVQIPYSTYVELDHVTISGNAGPGLVRVTYAPSLNIHDCSFTSTIAYDGAIYFNNTSAPTSFTLLNNTFYAPVPLSHLNGYGTTNLPAGSVIDGNTYHYGGPAWIQFRGNTYNISNAAQWAAWQGLGFDTSGSRVSP